MLPDMHVHLDHQMCYHLWNFYNIIDKLKIRNVHIHMQAVHILPSRHISPSQTTLQDHRYVNKESKTGKPYSENPLNPTEFDLLYTDTL